MLPSTRSRKFSLGTSCNRSSSTTQFPCRWFFTPCDCSSQTFMQLKSRYSSQHYESKDSVTHSLQTLCTLAFTHRRETIETYSKEQEITENSKQTGNLPLFYSDRRINTIHLGQFSSIIFIQLNITYIHTLLLDRSQLSATIVITLDNYSINTFNSS
jgi:hypothetical protein